jgi:hypothetical protein
MSSMQVELHTTLQVLQEAPLQQEVPKTKLHMHCQRPLASPPGFLQALH